MLGYAAAYDNRAGATAESGAVAILSGRIVSREAECRTQAKVSKVEKRGVGYLESSYWEEGQPYR